MLPFIIGEADSIPKEYRQYQSLIDACDVEKEQHGRVGYLTVMETDVSPARSQRRPGLHVERHPGNRWGAGSGWGKGSYADRRQGGLYMASNIAESTAVWNEAVTEPGAGGDCEHLRNTLGDADKVLAANELLWMTDSCVHESRPLEEQAHRQFFRLVTSEVDLWFAQHSTANNLGVKPPERVQIITENKFS